MLQSLGIGFVLGLAAYVGGYALKASATTEPFKLVGDLLYALGWALWTGVVVALFVEIIPRAKQRQIKQALNAYEAALRGARQRQSNQTLGAALSMPGEKSRSESAKPSKGDA